MERLFSISSSSISSLYFSPSPFNSYNIKNRVYQRTKNTFSKKDKKYKLKAQSIELKRLYHSTPCIVLLPMISPYLYQTEKKKKFESRLLKMVRSVLSFTTDGSEAILMGISRFLPFPIVSSPIHLFSLLFFSDFFHRKEWRRMNRLCV